MDRMESGCKDERAVGQKAERAEAESGDKFGIPERAEESGNDDLERSVMGQAAKEDGEGWSDDGSQRDDGKDTQGGDDTGAWDGINGHGDDCDEGGGTGLSEEDVGGGWADEESVKDDEEGATQAGDDVQFLDSAECLGGEGNKGNEGSEAYQASEPDEDRQTRAADASDASGDGNKSDRDDEGDEGGKGDRKEGGGLDDNGSNGGSMGKQDAGLPPEKALKLALEKLYTMLVQDFMKPPGAESSKSADDAFSKLMEDESMKQPVMEHLSLVIHGRPMSPYEEPVTLNKSLEPLVDASVEPSSKEPVERPADKSLEQPIEEYSGPLAGNPPEPQAEEFSKLSYKEPLTPASQEHSTLPLATTVASISKEPSTAAMESNGSVKANDPEKLPQPVSQPSHSPPTDTKTAMPSASKRKPARHSRYGDKEFTLTPGRAASTEGYSPSVDDKWFLKILKNRREDGENNLKFEVKVRSNVPGKEHRSVLAVQRAAEEGWPFSLVEILKDRCEEWDRYHHSCGEQVLDLIVKHARECDLVDRDLWLGVLTTLFFNHFSWVNHVSTQKYPPIMDVVCTMMGCWLPEKCGQPLWVSAQNLARDVVVGVGLKPKKKRGWRDTLRSRIGLNIGGWK